MPTSETPEEQARRVAASLSASDLGRAVEHAAGRDRPPVRLIPDVEDEITFRLDWLSEVLTGWDAADLEDGEEFEDPEEAAAANAAETVVDRVLGIIRPTQTDPRKPTEERVDGRWVPVSNRPEGYAGRLLAADGRFEFAPARLIEGISDEDITTVTEICERIIDGHGPLTEVANEVAESSWDAPAEAPDNGAAFARKVLGVMDVLNRTPFADENVETLMDALKHHDPNEDLVLTVVQSAAYQQWTTDTNTDLGSGPLERFGRAGISY